MKDKIKAHLSAANKARDEIEAREKRIKEYVRGLTWNPAGNVEPEMWIEFCRMRSTLTYRELNELVPDGMTIRCFFDETTGWQVWEYLM